VLTCVLYRLLCWVVGVLARGGGERELEIVVLRHQLAILKRGGKRPRYTTADRALLAAASRLLPPERWSCFAVGPQTLRRWHRALLEGGRRGRRRRPGRPPLAAEPRSLIIRLARENPRWGYIRIQGELLKLGIGVSPTTIATVLRSSGLGPAPRRTGPTWSEFLRAQAHSMLGGGLRDSFDGDTFEPTGWAADREARQVEADDNLTPADVAGPQLASQPLPVSSRQALARQCVLPASRGPSRLQPSHRSHARDGPKSKSAACPHNQVLWRKRQKPSPLHPASAPTTESDPLDSLLGSSAPTASVQPIDHRSDLPG
jgi:Homeodomain-like domain